MQSCYTVSLTHTQAIAVDVHVLNFSKAVGIVPEQADQEYARLVLEAIVPRIFFRDFNPIIGSFGQLLNRPAWAKIVLQTVDQSIYKDKISTAIHAWYTRLLTQTQEKRRRGKSTGATSTRKKKKKKKNPPRKKAP